MDESEEDGDGEGGGGGVGGFDEALEGISAEGDFFGERGDGEDGEIEEDKPELALGGVEGHDQSADEDDGQDAGDDAGPAEGGSDGDFFSPARTAGEAHGLDGFALALADVAHSRVSHDEKKEQHGAVDEFQPVS